ncbi:type II toxin-antitoxin system death-on-curing family toxin [Oceaniovalibus guishaninsula]|uniref:type II toxin-antitoxin system death-on-curing family toxin n=1 Tax=Oceaniovalibus guishaninsula TaxID=1046117 RepID=UPI00138ADA7B|nr:type II toxin-antitoxin system death-on-curing family toxin [Oceaniovalibus guishaninsula]
MLEETQIHPDLWNNYTWHLQQIDEFDYSGDRYHLSCEDVLDAHYLICNHFYRIGEGLGGFGPKDIGLLSSAVSRQVASAGGSFVYDTEWEIAASLIFGLVNNHPFYDANKRTAFLSSVFFMLESGYVPRVDISEIEDFMVDIASLNSREGRYLTVTEISSKFKTMFRERDSSTSYIITYRELRRILEQHGCSLRNPNGNYIDVYKGDSRVLKVGYPSESKEVGRKALMSIRKATGLTAENGYDAQVFFKGADPLKTLIGEYEAPLLRLANR